MLPALLSSATRVAVLPAGAGPLAAVLVPALAYVIAHRQLDISISLR